MRARDVTYESAGCQELFFEPSGAFGAVDWAHDCVGLGRSHSIADWFPPEPPVAMDHRSEARTACKGAPVRRAKFTLAGEHGSDTHKPMTGGSGGNQSFPAGELRALVLYFCFLLSVVSFPTVLN
jgi:hypothetical protein